MIGRPPKSAVLYVVDEESGCWIWQRATAGKGYGVMDVDGRMVYAHRVFYEREHGPIPDGYQVHHTCEQTLCVNPGHLEALTPLEHKSRHLLAVCRRGHELAAENVYVLPNGRRRCRACQHRRDAAYRARLRRAAA